VFQIWKQSEQVQPLIEYWAGAATGAQPLELAGFDCQFTGRNSYDHFVADLRGQLAAIGSDIESDPLWRNYRTILLNLARNYYYNNARPSRSQREDFFTMHDRVEKELTDVETDPDPEESAFWRQQIRSARTQAVRMWSIDYSDFYSNPDSLLNLRDRQMAENLVWLAEERYPGRKIIVWAATYHIVRNLSSIDVPAIPGLYDGLVPMGQIVAEALGNEMYTIGFTASDGMAGTIFEDPWPLNAPADGSLEDLLSQTSLDQLFVDYLGIKDDGAWLRERIESWPLGYMEMVADWTQIMDGVIYTRTMTPSTRVTAREESSSSVFSSRPTVLWMH
jgi:erythromycin esterase